MTPEQRLQITIDRLALELARERAAHRRTAEELDHAEEAARVWRRAVVRLSPPPPDSEDT